MDLKDMKKGLCSLKLEKMTKVYNAKGEIDPTMVRATFSILDFRASGNRQIISKQVGLECMNTLKYKPLVCEYIEATNYDEPNDDFGDHFEKNITLRNGEDYLSSGTTPIGVCENAYMGVVIDEEGNEIDCIMGDFLLWLYRYPNEISLINQFYENNEPLYSSCEHYYKSNSVDEYGNEVITSFILDGHCLLGRNVEPAYATSKLISFNESWNKAVNNIRKNKSINKKEVDKNMEKNNVMFEMLKSNNAISAGGFRWRIYDALSKVMVAEEYNNMYLSEYDIYPQENYCIYDTWTEENGWKLYKITFSVDENDLLTVDYEGRQEVEYKCDLVPVEELNKSLNEKTEEISTLTEELKELKESLNTKTSEIKTIISEKDDLSTKLNEANEMAISLNTKVEELTSEIETMKPIVEAHHEAEYNKVLNSVTEDYKEKFEKVGAIEVFESKDTQELIRKSINNVDLTEINEYKFQLNQLIIDNIKSVKVEKESPSMAKSINSVIGAKENKNLVSDFDDKYEELCGFKI